MFYKKNTVPLTSSTILLLVSSGNQVQPQIILDPDYLPEYLSVSYGYVFRELRFGLWTKPNFAVDFKLQILKLQITECL